MANNRNKKIIDRAREINDGWKQDTAAAGVKFKGIQQAAYEARLAEADAKMQEINENEARGRDLRDEYDVICRDVNGMSVNVREGVEGHEDYGNDSPLYGAMRFVRKSERASGLTRKKKDANK